MEAATCWSNSRSWAVLQRNTDPHFHGELTESEEAKQHHSASLNMALMSRVLLRAFAQGLILLEGTHFSGSGEFGAIRWRAKLAGFTVPTRS